MAATDVTTGNRLLTGADYLESLRDGREVWIAVSASRTSRPTRDAVLFRRRPGELGVAVP